jgi:hypothetical protein
MVDFNNDSIVNKTPTEVVNMIVIEHWYNTRLAFEYYIKARLNNINITTNEFRSRLGCLFVSINDMLKRKLESNIDSKKTYEDLFIVATDIETKVEYKDLLNAYLIISEVLDKIGLTRIDSRAYIDRKNIEASNKANNY